MKICKGMLIGFQTLLKTFGLIASREKYGGMVNISRISETVTVSFSSLKLRAISLASVPFHSVPSSTLFFVSSNKCVCSYHAMGTIEKFVGRRVITFTAFCLACHLSVSVRSHFPCFPVKGHKYFFVQTQFC